MGDYRVRVTVESDEYDVLLRVEYETQDGYDIAESIEREVVSAIDEHLLNKDWGEDEHLREGV